MKIAILGFGTVGRGVYEILKQRDTKNTAQLEAAHIFIRKGKEKTLSIMQDDYETILQDKECSCIVEVMGGIEPAHTYILQALNAGKHVVTANKAVVAAHLKEFMEAAKANHVQFRYEASCAGGIPWIHSLQQAKRIDPIDEISGIFNGTGNYIIDQMVKHHLDFDVALKQAQEAGYAEADPSADIDGIDTANKAVISASLAFGTYCCRDFPISGIRNLKKSDLDLFLSEGRSVRLMMKAVCSQESYSCVVEPMLVADASLEAHIPDNFNLTTLHGKTLGELKLYGQGAGSLPTGNAIVSDVIAVAKQECYDEIVMTEKKYDSSLLKGNYRLRVNGTYTKYESVDPQWMHEQFRMALQKDETAFLVRDIQ